MRDGGVRSIARQTFHRRTRYGIADHHHASRITHWRRSAPMNVTVCNPLLRTPLSLIIDDSCPVINKAYYWIQQRHEWRMRHHPDRPASGWEKHYDKLDRMPNTIPAAFAERWGAWCGEQGVK